MLGLTGTLTRKCAARLFTTLKTQVASRSHFALGSYSTTFNPCRPIHHSTSLSFSLCRTFQVPTDASRIHKRCKSTFAIDPSVRKVASGLAQTQPTFMVSANMIKILREPTEFYGLLLVSSHGMSPEFCAHYDIESMIRRAERRIFISSLYIGSAESELVRFTSFFKDVRVNISTRLRPFENLSRTSRQFNFTYSWT